MKEEIQKIIRENLPAEVSKILKGRLALLDNLEKENKEQKELLQYDADAMIKLREQAKILVNKVETDKSLKTREKAISEREQTLEIKIMEIKLKEQEKRIVENKEMVSLVFKSPVFEQQINQNKTMSEFYQQNGRDNIPYESNVSTVITKSKK